MIIKRLPPGAWVPMGPLPRNTCCVRLWVNACMCIRQRVYSSVFVRPNQAVSSAPVIEVSNVSAIFHLKVTSL